MWQGGRRCYANARPSSRLVELAIRTIGIELIDDDIVEALQEWDASTLGRGPNDAPRDHRATLERGSKSGKFSRRSFLLRGEIWKALLGDQSDVPDFRAWLFTRRSGDPAKAMTRLFTRYPMNAKTAKAFGEAYALIVDRLIGGNVKRTV